MSSEKKEQHAKLLQYSTKGACDGWLPLNYGMHAQASQPILFLEFEEVSYLEEMYKKHTGTIVPGHESRIGEVQKALVEMLSDSLQARIKQKEELSEEDKKQVFQELRAKLITKRNQSFLNFERIKDDFIEQKHAHWGILDAVIVNQLLPKMKAVIQSCAIPESDHPNVHMIGAGYHDNTVYLTEFIVFLKKGNDQFQCLGRISLEKDDSDILENSLSYVFPL